MNLTRRPPFYTKIPIFGFIFQKKFKMETAKIRIVKKYVEYTKEIRLPIDFNPIFEPKRSKMAKNA